MSRRNLYKRERAPARDKGVLFHAHAPVGCLDANEGEVSKAIFAVAKLAGVIVGRGSGYDSLRDRYYVIGKDRVTGKAQDFQFEGAVVAAAIYDARRLNGGKLQFNRRQRRAAVAQGR
jgi:hypothetical protein